MNEHKLCVNCGCGEMVYETRDLTFTYKHVATLVPAMAGWFCPQCGEAYLDDGARYAQACADHVDAVKKTLGQRIKAIRKRLGLTQVAAADLFGGGVNAFSEYERGKTQPHPSTVLLLGLLDRHPDLLAEVEQAA